MFLSLWLRCAKCYCIPFSEYRKTKWSRTAYQTIPNNNKKQKVEFTKCSAHGWWAPTLRCARWKRVQKNCSHCDMVRSSFVFYLPSMNVTHLYIYVSRLMRKTLVQSAATCFFCVSNQNGQTTIQQSSDVCIGRVSATN